jgi:cyclopropane-fatty-acyl-phospholipid synthase
MMTSTARRIFLDGLAHVRGGSLHLRAGGDYRFGDRRDGLDASIEVMHDRFFARALAFGDIGLGESYMDGDWRSPDLVPLIRLMLRNVAAVEDRGGPVRAAARAAGLVARRLRDNSPAGSRRHIHRHYDLGNEFFRLFLDGAHRMYSCAVYGSARDTLEKAQENKIDGICRKLMLSPDDRVLEIGAGWGGFCVWAATRYGCRVTTTTISEEQYRFVSDLVDRLHLRSRITVLRQDYRELQGRFDKIVSIEMFEAVGLRHYRAYFEAVERLLASDGAMLLQTITIADRRFDAYRRSPDWIEKYIFPGGELASLHEILSTLRERTSIELFAAENIGMHYAWTLRHWRERFRARLGEVRALGFDERFIRMWDLYLAYSEAAFLERHIGDVQLLLVKSGCARPLFNEVLREPQGFSQPAADEDVLEITA